MAAEDDLNKMIGMYQCLQKQLYYQQSEIEELRESLIEVRRKIEH